MYIIYSTSGDESKSVISDTRTAFAMNLVHPERCETRWDVHSSSRFEAISLELGKSCLTDRGMEGCSGLHNLTYVRPNESGRGEVEERYRCFAQTT